MTFTPGRAMPMLRADGRGLEEAAVARGAATDAAIDDRAHLGGGRTHASALPPGAQAQHPADGGRAVDPDDGNAGTRSDRAQRADRAAVRDRVLLAVGIGGSVALAVAGQPLVGVGVAAIAQIVWWRAGSRSRGDLVEASTRVHGVSADLVRARLELSVQMGLTRRIQRLVGSQIALLADREQFERDPDRLADLFAVDHLATRTRRAIESQLALNGDEPHRRWSGPVGLADVVRAAVSEVEGYQRVDLRVDEGLTVDGASVTDVAHLLAELVENALAASPGEVVVVRTHRSRENDGGPLVSVEDRGPGLDDHDRDALNAAFASGSASGPGDGADPGSRLGVVVASRLAARRGVAVFAAPTPGGGLTVVVRLPAVASRRPGDDIVADLSASLVPMAGPAAAWPLRAVPSTVAAPRNQGNGDGGLHQRIPGDALTSSVNHTEPR